MHRPSAIASRWRWELAKLDVVGGAVIAIIIVVSFLSLMSFAEFLRFQWGGAQQQQQQQQLQQVGNGLQNVGNGANNPEGGIRGLDSEAEIDEIKVHPESDDDDDDDPLAPFLNHLMARDEDSVDDYSFNSDINEIAGLHRENRRGDENGILGRGEDQLPMHGGNNHDHYDSVDEHDFEMFMRAQEDQDSIDENNQHLHQHQNDRPDDFDMFMRAQEDQDWIDENNQHLHQHQNDGPDHNRNHLHPGDEDDDEHDNPEIVRQPQQRPQNIALNPRQRDNARFEPQFEPLQPAFVDVDALDDGPVSTKLLSIHSLNIISRHAFIYPSLEI